MDTETETNAYLRSAIDSHNLTEKLVEEGLNSPNN